MSRIEHVNPPGLPANPAFTHAVAVEGAHCTIYVGGQNAVDENEQIVGSGDIEAQTRQIFANLRCALQACGADLEHIVKWNIHVVHGQPVEPALLVFQQEWGQRAEPPAISVAFVSGLANPEFLAEIDAVAVVPLQGTSRPDRESSYD
jgi:enamine deaminase RidA (YjgF/YER057c/UK114 family)